jgi:hypothetical protein
MAWAVDVLMDFTRLQAGDDQFHLYLANTGLMKIVALLRLILKGGVVVSKRAISAIRG